MKTSNYILHKMHSNIIVSHKQVENLNQDLV